MVEEVGKAYRSVLAADSARWMFPVLMLIALVFVAFSLINLTFHHQVMFVADLCLAVLLFLLGLSVKYRFFSTALGACLLLSLFFGSILGVYIFPHSFHGALYNYSVLPFFAFYLVGSRAASAYCGLIVGALWLCCFTACMQWLMVSYSIEETIMFTTLFIFTSICAWLFEKNRKQNFVQAYEEGLHHEALLSTIDVVYYRVALDGILEEISEPIVAMSGFALDELIGQPILGFYAKPSERDAYLRTLKKHGAVKNYPITILGKNKQHIVIAMSARIVLNEQGEALHIEGMFRDISQETAIEQERTATLQHLYDLSRVESALATPDFAQGVLQSMQELCSIFAASRAFVVPVDMVNDGKVNQQKSGQYDEGFMAKDGVFRAFSSQQLMLEDVMVATLRETETETETEFFPVMTEKSSVLLNKILKKYEVKSCLMILLRVKPNVLWLMALHQCEHEVAWSEHQKQLFLDISHRVRGTLGQMLLQQHLHISVEKAEVASQAKGAFLSTMSHELRTPLHGVIGLLDLLDADASCLPPEQQHNLMLARSSAHVLSSLIDDVLDLSKIESGKEEIQCQAFQLEGALRQAMIPFIAKAKSKGLMLELEVDDVACCVQGDALRLRQVLLNLLGNALKFTQYGYVRLVVRQAHGVLQFQIEDSGIGIEEHKQQHIFEPFVQVHDRQVLGDNLQEKGTGLGTTIAKNFVEMMGGSITLHSEWGVGTTFSLRLPCLPVGEQRFSLALDRESLVGERASPREKMSPEKARQWRVLLAEDDPIGRRIAKKRLTREGFVVTLAVDGLAAWQEILKQPFDLLLTDLRMPRMDGLKLTRKVREREAAQENQQKMLIIGLSAHALEEVKHQALAVGMDEFVAKPVDMQSLMAKLETHCARHGD